MKKYDDEIIVWDLAKGKITVDFLRVEKINFIISFGYNYIFPPSVIEYCPIINLHASYLPWNRGPVPNFWSWLTDSPKGVTMHYIDAGIDTGDIIAQKKLDLLHDGMTLNQTYWATIEALVEVFTETWPLIREGKNQRYPQIGQGSCHTLKDIIPFQDVLKNSSEDTPIRELREAIQSKLDSTKKAEAISQGDFWMRLSQQRSRKQVKN
ncbi:formyl transferase [Nostoc sp. KVJ3]|nr:formyl transferase [Nostoc sp. KVJ3]